MYLILRPLTPPAALASSNARRTELELFTPCTAVTPDRSVAVPMMISVSVTPCTVCAIAVVVSIAAAKAAIRHGPSLWVFTSMHPPVSRRPFVTGCLHRKKPITPFRWRPAPPERPGTDRYRRYPGRTQSAGHAPGRDGASGD